MSPREFLILVACTTLLGGSVVSSVCGQDSYGTDRRESPTVPDLPEVDRIRGDQVFTVLPKDAIPAIDNPRFATADRAVFMEDEEPVIGVVSGGTAKAYSVWHLDRHEIVNDEIGEVPVAVTW